MGCKRQPPLLLLLKEPGEPALLRLTLGCWSELLGADILLKVAVLLLIAVKTRTAKVAAVSLEEEMVREEGGW